MKEEEYEEMSKMDFLNAKQLTILSIIVLLIIQTIPLFISPTPFTEWMLLGYTAGVSTCAIVGAILVQHNADKITLMYRRAFNKEFYMTIDTLNEVRKGLEEEGVTESLPEILGLKWPPKSLKLRVHFWTASQGGRGRGSPKKWSQK